MKDQYFGDRTDYIKHGILRLVSSRLGRLGIHWAWTPDDGSSDGSRTSYLRAASEWRHYDPELFDELHHAVTSGDRRLKRLEERQTIPNAYHVFSEWQVCATKRRSTIDELLGQAMPGELVFLDPDNGLEVSSVPEGSRMSYKYVYFDEVAYVWSSGVSVCVYQHFPRVKREPYVQKRLVQLREHCAHGRFAAIITSRVAFLCAFQEQSADAVLAAIKDAVSHWSPHVYLVTLDGAGLTRATPETSARPGVQQDLPLCL